MLYHLVEGIRRFGYNNYLDSIPKKAFNKHVENPVGELR